MRAWLLIIGAVLLPAISSLAAYSIRNPAVGNPVGSGRAPVSTIRDSLIPVSSPIDGTADLSITGNIRDGKYFRGNVPYRSTTDFGMDPGSSALNSSRTEPSLSSFLRDAAGQEDFGGRSRQYGTRPYYSPNEMVARTVPGNPNVFGPSNIGPLGGPQPGRPQTTHLFSLEPLSNRNILSGPDAAAADPSPQGLHMRYTPVKENLSTSDGMFVNGMTEDMDNVGNSTTRQVAISRHNERLMVERQIKPELTSSLESRPESGLGEERLATEGGSSVRVPSNTGSQAAVGYRLYPRGMSDPAADPTLWKSSIRPEGVITPELHTPAAIPETESRDDFPGDQTKDVTTGAVPLTLAGSKLLSQVAPGSAQDDAMERIRQQINDLARSIESSLKTETDSVSQSSVGIQARESYQMAPRTEPHASSSRNELKTYEPVGVEASGTNEILAPAETGREYDGLDNLGKAGFNSAASSSLDDSRRIAALPHELAGLSRAEVSGEARRLMGSHQSIDSFSNDKFSQHVLVAESHLIAGRYYKAADSFALALIYRPDDPEILAARSRALFAAGEYISSALFLSRALEIRPEYAGVKIDMVTLLGDRGKLARRIADVEQWLARSGSGRLQLLLGYVYFQVGRISEAKQAIEAARTKMPQSLAAAAIKAVIDTPSTRQ